jgi:hypothetical protein
VNEITAPTLLQFPTTPVGQTSTQVLSVANAGPADLDGATLSVAGQFRETGACPTELPAGAVCSISVSFNPASPGPQAGSLAVDANGVTLKTVALIGEASEGTLALSPSSLSLAASPVGQPGPSGVIEIVNGGNAPLPITRIVITGDLRQTNDCPQVLAVGVPCGATITSYPTVAGSHNGVLAVETGDGQVALAEITSTGLARPNSGQSPGRGLFSTLAEVGGLDLMLPVVAPHLSFGRGAATSDFAVSKYEIAFAGIGNIDFGTPTTFTVRNLGKTDLRIHLAVVGPYLADGCGQSVPPGTTCTVSMTAGTTHSPKEGAVIVSDQDGFTRTVALLSATVAPTPTIRAGPPICGHDTSLWCRPPREGRTMSGTNGFQTKWPVYEVTTP